MYESNLAMHDRVDSIAKKIIAECMGVKPGESVLVVTDTIRKDLGEPIYKAALDLGYDTVYMEMSPRHANNYEPPKAVADAMYNADVIVAVTKASMSHTQAKISAVKHGARIATMPLGAGSTDFITQVFTGGGMTADYRSLDESMRRLARYLNSREGARITSEKGTDMAVKFEGREFHVDSGIAHNPGDFTNLPAGELFVAPADANGVIVVDLTMGSLGRLSSPLTIEVKNGMAYSIKGERAEELENYLGQFGPQAMNLAELGIGMNPKARICGLLVEDEKVARTVHFALGSNAAFGGNVNIPVHLDGVIGDARIFIDGNALDMDQYLSAAATEK